MDDNNSDQWDRVAIRRDRMDAECRRRERDARTSTFSMADMEATQQASQDSNQAGPSTRSRQASSQGSSHGSSQGSSQGSSASSGQGEVLYFDVQSEEIIMEGDEDPEALVAVATTTEEVEVGPSDRAEPESGSFKEEEPEGGISEGAEPEVPGPAAVDHSTLGEAASHYSVLEGTSQRQKPLLVDTRGYSYTRKKEGKNSTYWRCSVRNKHLQCNACVRQEGEKFTMGNKPHVHPARPADVVKYLLIGKMKQRARWDASRMPSAIVNEVLAEETGPCGHIPGLPTKGAMARRLSRLQGSMEAETPLTQDFMLNPSLLPAGYIRQDVRSRGLRHLVMATDVQLHHLMTAKRWYVDVILNQVAKPFTQLLCISCFAMKIRDVQLVPICFILMSSGKTKDYKAVFRAMLEMLSGEHKISEVVLDYDRALWKAFGEVFGEGVVRKGSLTHFKQSIRWKINQVGLGRAYEDSESPEHRLLSELMALPYLPAHLIWDTYQFLVPQAQDEKMAGVFEYVSDLWIEDELWSPQTWSVYNQSVVWFNQFAGWRQRIRQPSSTTAPFYRLVKLLFTQSQRFTAYVMSVSERKMKKLQQSRFKGTQHHLGIWWKDYQDQKMTSTQLLQVCGQLFGDEPIETYQGAAQEKD